MIVQGMKNEGLVEITNVRLYGLEESIIASAYPMQTETDCMLNHYTLNVWDESGYVTPKIIDEGVLKRFKNLAQSKSGSGHDCFLKGITLQFDLTVSEYIWRQLDRYHFIDYVSSQSKMHRITRMNIDEMTNKYVSELTLLEVKKHIEMYNNFTFYKDIIHKEVLTLRNGEEIPFNKENLYNIIIANCPCGLMLTARMTTNYLQLKSIYYQRRNHKMQEWRLICKWIEKLPLFDLIIKEDK